MKTFLAAGSKRSESRVIFFLHFRILCMWRCKSINTWRLELLFIFQQHTKQLWIIPLINFISKITRLFILTFSYAKDYSFIYLVVYYADNPLKIQSIKLQGKYSLRISLRWLIKEENLEDESHRISFLEFGTPWLNMCI